MSLFSADGGLFLLRWLHFLGGVSWIGMLYYFNFVQTPFFTAADPAVRTGMITGDLVDRALWWFRWGAMLTFLSGWLYLLHRMFGQAGVGAFFGASYGWSIFIGGVLGSLMWLNVWFVIWPAQRIVIDSTKQVAKGGKAIPNAASRGQRATFVSRTNTLLSIPMLFFMGAASHFPFFTPTSGGAKVAMFVVFGALVALVEANAMMGRGVGKKLLGSVAAVLWAGFVLTAIFFAALKVIFR